jgi:hypothetical protein
MSMSIRITHQQAKRLVDLFGDEEGEFTLTFGAGHSGIGLHAHHTEYPEDGAHLLIEVKRVRAADKAAA